MTTIEEATTLRVGSLLPNGAIVLAVKAVGAGVIIVLALSRGEFVTWCADASGDTFWGHYFPGDLPGALADFNERG